MLKCIRFQVRFIVEPDDGCFYAYCPTLKGVHAEGDTVEEALRNVRDAAEAYLMSLLNNNDPLPLCADELTVTGTLSALVERFFRSRGKGSRIERVEELYCSYPAAA